MTTDNRTNEPTEAMILAGLNAYSSKGLELDGYEATEEYPSLEMWGDRFASLMRAALVAAQGAAPQADSEELAWYKRAAKHSADSMAEARATLQQFADRVDPFVFDELSSVLDDQPLDYETGWAIGEAAPALPSSGVDEDALAEVIATASTDWDFYWSEYREVKGEDPGPNAEYVARAVIASRAEWLKGQGR